jgi:hypothetical protein
MRARRPQQTATSSDAALQVTGHGIREAVGKGRRREADSYSREKGSVVDEKRDVLRREIDEAIARAEKGQRRKPATRSDAAREGATADEATTGSQTEPDQTPAGEALRAGDQKESPARRQ